MTVTEHDTSVELLQALEERILVLDGAMGTMVQALALDEAAIRGEPFRDHPKDLSRFVDVLGLSQPEKLTEIHRQYLAAGADIITTNTFGASRIGMEGIRTPFGNGRTHQSRCRGLRSGRGR